MRKRCTLLLRGREATRFDLAADYCADHFPHVRLPLGANTLAPHGTEDPTKVVSLDTIYALCNLGLGHTSHK